MTKQQKTTQVLAIVQEGRVWYTQDEFVSMVREIWKGLDQAQVIAVENAPAQVPPP